MNCKPLESRWIANLWKVDELHTYGKSMNCTPLESRWIANLWKVDESQTFRKSMNCKPSSRSIGKKPCWKDWFHNQRLSRFFVFPQVTFFTSLQKYVTSLFLYPRGTMQIHICVDPIFSQDCVRCLYEAIHHKCLPSLEHAYQLNLHLCSFANTSNLQSHTLALCILCAIFTNEVMEASLSELDQT